VGVLVIRILLFTAFCIVCTGFLYCFVYVYLFLFVSFVLLYGLLPQSENSIAVSNSTNIITNIIINIDVHKINVTLPIRVFIFIAPQTRKSRVRFPDSAIRIFY